MRFRVVEIEVRQALTKSGLPDLDYALNPYLGCGHGCLYCYAKIYTRLSEVVANWGKIIAVKKNLLDILTNEVERLKRGTVGIGTITDPYQPIEAIYRLTREEKDKGGRQDGRSSWKQGCYICGASCGGHAFP
ncbi:MAG: hypothetical protein QW438_06515 [Ignisphaera sp.]